MHHYRVTTVWTGNLGSGTSGYRSYSRDHDLTVEGKYAPISASSDKPFRGDPSRYNPEELLVAALSSCHMLITSFSLKSTLDPYAKNGQLATKLT